MTVDLDAINREEFVCEERQTLAGTLWLVCPRKMKFKWRPGEESLRSLLCRADGTVVSSGFPKFRNYGESPVDDAVTDAALAAGEVTWTEKVDGSLIIRSVVDGVVLWRTRGSHELGVFEAPVMALVRERWPTLINPAAGRAVHLLFEYTGPDNRVVLRYEASALTLLGFVQAFGEFAIVGSPDEMSVDFLAGCPPPARSHALPSGLDAARSEVSGWTDREGVVAWCRTDAGYHLAKFKALRYLKLHALRSNLTEARTWALCHANGIGDVAALGACFAEAGLDWEAVEHARPWLDSYLARCAEIDADCRAARARMRKGIALAAKEATADRPDLFGWALHSSIGETEKAADIRAALILGMGVAEYRARRAEMASLNLGPAPEDV